jgi:hypothetical protein
VLQNTMARTKEWEARDVVFVFGSLTVSAVLVWMAALAIGPFAGTGALWLLVVLAVVSVIFFYASLGTLAVGG